MWYQSLLEKNIIPDGLIRMGIRRLLKQRLQEESLKGKQALPELVDELKRSPIAVHTSAANEQHYEVPTLFYTYCLGKHLKYSSGYWREGVNDIDTSEADMLQLTCERAELADDQEVLELGCGWGSLSLYMAARYPSSNFTVVSNSRTQKLHIDTEAEKRGVKNLNVITADINDFKPESRFDRVVSVEMFEHLRNYEVLFKRIASWLTPEGKVFVHVFTHKELAYKFEVKDDSDWMSRYFFTGGIMPSNDLFSYFNEDLVIKAQWDVSGMHYHKTSEAWLKNMDAHRAEIMPLFKETYGNEQALKWWVYWRVFFMACAELWGYKNGTEWMVQHYLFSKRSN
ncbi:MAG: class I SAM-dependent methyltransferase [Sediminibacterium sp.]|nr:class I SAM-dependent methyltransferase [Sediminibacterium sp.]